MHRVSSRKTVTGVLSSLGLYGKNDGTGFYFSDRFGEF
jgi:hypothetical protein